MTRQYNCWDEIMQTFLNFHYNCISFNIQYCTFQIYNDPIASFNNSFNRSKVLCTWRFVMRGYFLRILSTNCLILLLYRLKVNIKNEASLQWMENSWKFAVCNIFASNSPKSFQIRVELHFGLWSRFRLVLKKKNDERN